MIICKIVIGLIVVPSQGNQVKYQVSGNVAVRQSCSSYEMVKLLNYLTNK